MSVNLLSVVWRCVYCVVMMQIQIRIRIHVMFAIWLFSFNSRFLISSWLPSLIWLNPSNSGSITPWCSLNRNLLANCAHSCLPVFIYWTSAGSGSVPGSVFEFPFVLDPYSEYGSGPGSRVKTFVIKQYYLLQLAPSSPSGSLPPLSCRCRWTAVCLPTPSGSRRSFPLHKITLSPCLFLYVQLQS